MVSMGFVFWMFVALAAVIGAMRGWAKELLVIFSGVLAIFIILVMETYVGFVQGLIQSGGASMQFWVRTATVLLLAFFGYQTPRIKAIAGAARREQFRDSLLGIGFGAINGWLIIGSIWAYLDKAGYIYNTVFISPKAGTEWGDAAINLLRFMPPNWLEIPGIYFLVAIAFTFVVIVYV
jgi:hypothetical protein